MLQDAGRVSYYFRHCSTAIHAIGSFYISREVGQSSQSELFSFVYPPTAINLVNSTTTYAYDPRTRLYQQPTFAFQTLQRFLTVNSYRLDQLKTTVDVELERRATIPSGTLLSDLVRAGIKERALAPTILMALIVELQKQTE